MIMNNMDKHIGNGVRIEHRFIKELNKSMWGLVDSDGNNLSEFKYTYIEPWGEGYYKCEIGTQKNLLRADGSEILSQWFNDVFQVYNGFFEIGITIRKSKNNPQTKYLSGLANVNGDIIFPPIFEQMRWLDVVTKEALYGELNGKAYVLLLNGGIYDPERAHLPQKNKISDNFPWDGPKNTICDGCIYSKGIKEKAEGCGRLFKKSFRQNVVKGECEFYKTELNTPSYFEEKKKREQQEAILKAKKVSNIYARNLVLSFIKDKLDGNIKNLVDFNFKELKNDNKYGDCGGYAFSTEKTSIVKAIMSIAFSEVWPNISYEAFDKLEYEADIVNTFSMLFGLPLGENFKGLQKFRPSAEILDRVWTFYRQHYTIGNFVVWPMNKASLALCRNKMGRKYQYIDSFIKALHTACCNTKKGNKDLLQITKSKKFNEYRSNDGFALMCNRLMLDDYLDHRGNPKPIFEGIWSDQKDLSRDEYFNAVNNYLDFCEKIIYDRSKKIINKLKIALDLTDDNIKIDQIIKLDIPDEYHVLESLPEDPKDSISYGKDTSMSIGFIQTYPIPVSQTMPMDNNEIIINGIHKSLSNNQGLIEVKSGFTRYNKQYAYSIVKNIKNTNGVIYILTMHIMTKLQAICIKGNFEERGTTGVRDTTVFEYCRRENLIKFENDKVVGWNKDPYDENFNFGITMNLSENIEYDRSFPLHPLSQLRSFIAEVIDKN